jgi:hypothetical protein
MIGLGWSAPTHRMDVGTARRAILWQHAQIRRFLAKARGIADLALDGEPVSPDAVASAVGDLRSIMEVHLTFEEKALLPFLREDSQSGTEPADRLLEEHQQQRGMLATLHREACAHPELPTLATKLSFLTAWLLADMTEEERCLTTPQSVQQEQAPRR